MSRHGVGDGVRVVLYDRAVNMWAARIWWMLRAFGFENAAVLDGGWKKWTVEGRAVATDAGERPPRTFTPKPRPELIADRAAVLAAIDSRATCVLNALSAEQHRGAGAHYGRPGRIRGSVNVAARAWSIPRRMPTCLGRVPEALRRGGALDAGR
jgi:thiosulfate/3-mercaptopyruvate sulfurtransferase